MRSIPFFGRLACVIATTGFFQSAIGQQPVTPPRYTVTDLGLANGSTPGQPFVIKNSGLIAESAAVSDAWHAMLFFEGIKIDLAKKGGLGGPNSSAFGANEWGQAAGEAETRDLDPNSEDFCGFGSHRICKAFFWQNGGMSALPVAGHNAAAKGINILGQIAGTAENSTPDSTCPPYDPTTLQFQTYQFKPVIWARGEIQQLPTSGIDSNGKAFDDPDGVVFRINDSGVAVGATGSCTGYTPLLTYLNSLHATLWRNGAVIDLGNLGGIAPGLGNFAYDINRWGNVVGTSGTSDGSFHAFFWNSKTHIQDLGTIPGDVASVGLAINDIGDIGGISFPADQTASPRAFIRGIGGTMVDLNSLIPPTSELYLFSTCSINSRGEIIGLALDSQGYFHGYLAKPSGVPADSSDASSASIRASRFENAWSLVRDRFRAFAVPSR